MLKTFPAKDSIKLVITNEVLVVLIWPLKKEPQVTALSLHVVKSRPFLKTVDTKIKSGVKRGVIKFYKASKLLRIFLKNVPHKQTRKYRE